MSRRDERAVRAEGITSGGRQVFVRPFQKFSQKTKRISLLFTSSGRTRDYVSAPPSNRISVAPLFVELKPGRFVNGL